MRSHLVAALWLACGPSPAPFLLPIRPLPSCNPRRRSIPCSSRAASVSSDVPAWPRSPHPSPYDVLGMPRDSPYSKARFYQLVKLYHPDSHACSSSSALPPAVRLERYRLVVAAHDILSDPAKRRLYDLHGLGWLHHGCHSELAPHRQQSEPVRRTQPDPLWRHRPGSAANNATWEDWVAWHEARRRRTGDASPDWMRASTEVKVRFSSLLVYLVLIASVFSFLVTESSSKREAQRAQQRTAAIGQEVRRSTEAKAGRSMDERVDHFLRYRHNEWHLRYRRNANDHVPTTTSTEVAPRPNRP
ncbi:hypothetical protein XA68_14764 [Ophiocordyceps unilateralis]|uniref:J domain-containing protein n=1 Tax=Ophiocordyceps unilateralis TaxID=268505 RepID=A0A2A9P881_OPHUN|nr:hypothetical protein XA68_14764 [Ophiocordyceps unilateralis]